MIGQPSESSSALLAPSFLIRRLHQIHLSFFYEEAGKLGVTAVQMNVLLAISRISGRDQSSVAEEIGTDRATLATVLARLEVSGLVRRVLSQKDHRQKLLYLTLKGKKIVQKIQDPLQRANERTLQPLEPSSQELFLSLMSKLIEGGNQYARTRFKIPESD